MNLTRHFQERWAERIVGVPKTESRAYVVENHERIAEHAEKMMAHAQFLYCGAINSNPICNYYLKDNTVIVVNQGNDALVTIYQIDLGFTDELNQVVRRGLVQEVDRLQEQKEGIKAEIDDRVTQKELEIAALHENISLLEEEIKNAKLSIEFKKEAMREERRELVQLENQIKRHTITLVNSLEYQKDRLLLSKELVKNN